VCDQQQSLRSLPCVQCAPALANMPCSIVIRYAPSAAEVLLHVFDVKGSPRGVIVRVFVV
jgi:hypothetical protein